MKERAVRLVFEAIEEAGGEREDRSGWPASWGMSSTTISARLIAGLEPTAGYYARTAHEFLRSLGLEVHWVKNKVFHDARDAVYVKKTKTDPVDSRLIARLFFLREAVGQEYSFSTGYEQIGSYAKVGLLVSNLWKLKQAQARAGNQLTQILDVVFPELATIFTKSVTSHARSASWRHSRLQPRYRCGDAELVRRAIVFVGRVSEGDVLEPDPIQLATRLGSTTTSRISSRPRPT